MTDSTEKSTGLDKVVAAVTDAVKDKEPKEKKTSPWGWVSGLIVAAVGMILLAGLSWWLNRKGRELAKLKHARDVQEAKAHIDKVNANLATNADEASRLIVRSAKASIKAGLIDKQVKEVERAAKAVKDKIDAIENWDGVDRFLARRSDGRST